MRTLFRFLATATAVFLGLLLTLSLPIILLLHTTTDIVLDPDRVTQLVVDAALRSQLVPYGLQWYARDTLKRSIPPDEQANYLALLDAFTIEDWNTLRTLFVSDAMLDAWARTTADGLNALLENPGTKPVITWDMMPLREHLQGENGSKALLLVYERMPACTQTQTRDFETVLENTQGVVAYPWCRLPDPWRSDQQRAFQDTVHTVAEKVPDTFVLSDYLWGGATPEMMVTLAQRERQIRTISRWGIALPLVCLWLIAALVVRTWHSLAVWWGVPLLLGGGLTWGTSRALPILLQSSLRIALRGIFSNYPPLQEEVLRLLKEGLALFTSALTWQGALIAGLGLLLLLMRLLPTHRPA